MIYLPLNAHIARATSLRRPNSTKKLKTIKHLKDLKALVPKLQKPHSLHFRFQYSIISRQCASNRQLRAHLAHLKAGPSLWRFLMAETEELQSFIINAQTSVKIIWWTNLQLLPMPTIHSRTASLAIIWDNIDPRLHASDLPLSLKLCLVPKVNIQWVLNNILEETSSKASHSRCASKHHKTTAAQRSLLRTCQLKRKVPNPLTATFALRNAKKEKTRAALFLVITLSIAHASSTG